MKYTNILEKLLLIADMIFSNWIYMTFIGIAAFFLVLTLFKIISKKKTFTATFISYIALLTYTIVVNLKPLGNIGNSLTDNFFTNIYFPSTYTYLFTLIVIDVVTFVSLMKEKGNKAYKWIHGIFFFITQFILILILELLSKNNIDIFSKTSIFSNKHLVMLLESSINVFIIWIITVVFTYLTNLITEKVEKIENEETEIPTNIAIQHTEVKIPETQVSIPTEQEPAISVAFNKNTNKFIPNINTNSNINIETTIKEEQPINIKQENNINLNELIPQKQENIIPTPMTSEVIFEKILNNDLPVIKEEKQEQQEQTNQYTLNDYRLFNKMLKEIKEYNKDNNVTIDKNLEYRLITKYSTETFNMFKGMLKIYSN